MGVHEARLIQSTFVEALKSRVDSLKDEGNALHKKRKYAQAVSKYTEAIDAIKSLDAAAMRAEGITQRDLAVLYRWVYEGGRRVSHSGIWLFSTGGCMREVSGYHADTPITIKAEAIHEADSRSH